MKSHNNVSPEPFEVLALGLSPPRVPSSWVPVLDDHGVCVGQNPPSQTRAELRCAGGIAAIAPWEPSHWCIGEQLPMEMLPKGAQHNLVFCSSPQAMAMPLQTTEEEEAVVFHHHYIPYPSPAPVLPWPVPVQDRGLVAVRHLGTGSLAEDGEV